MTDKELLFKINRTPAAYIAFGVEFACTAVAAYFSWIAGVAVLVAIFTQACWQVYLDEKKKEYTS